MRQVLMLVLQRARAVRLLLLAALLWHRRPLQLPLLRCLQAGSSVAGWWVQAAWTRAASRKHMPGHWLGGVSPRLPVLVQLPAVQLVLLVLGLQQLELLAVQWLFRRLLGRAELRALLVAPSLLPRCQHPLLMLLPSLLLLPKRLAAAAHSSVRLPSLLFLRLRL